MAKTRNSYEKAFKLEAIAQARKPGQSVPTVAQSLGVESKLLKRWIKEYENLGDRAFPGMGYSFGQDEPVIRIRELEAEIKRLRKENLILKQASIVFAREINLSV